MPDIKALVSLETSVGSTLAYAVHDKLVHLIALLQPKLDAGDWHGAHLEIDKFTFMGALDEHQNRLEELAVSALLFGAHHVTGDLHTTSFVKDKRQLPPELMSALNQLKVGVEGNGSEIVRQQAHAFVDAAYRAATEHHYKEDIGQADLDLAGKLNPEQTEFIDQGEKQTLYVHRDVLNAEEIIAWAKGQGFATTLPHDDLHVTVCFSRTKVVWPQPRPQGFMIHGGKRTLQQFGEATVLTFESEQLQEEWQTFQDLGASWDHPQYHPHITISYNGSDLDLADIEPYDGPIDLGPEIFSEVKEDWADNIVEKSDAWFDAWIQKAADDDLAGMLNDAVVGTGRAVTDIGANLTTSRLVSLGFLAEAVEQGVDTYEISAELDSKTCPVCKALDGRQFEVRREYHRLIQVLGVSDPNELRSIAPWPKQSKEAVASLQEMSSAELQAQGFAIPPFHPGCRCTPRRVSHKQTVVIIPPAEAVAPPKTKPVPVQAPPLPSVVEQFVEQIDLGVAEIRIVVPAEFSGISGLSTGLLTPTKASLLAQNGLTLEVQSDKFENGKRKVKAVVRNQNS